MKIATLIVDDEKMARRELAYLVELDQRFEVKAKAANGKEAVKFLEENEFGLLLLDIKMPGASGIEVARVLKEADDPPQLVFTTAYDEYAVEAFKLAAVDYLLKPISEDRFNKTLDRVWNKIEEDKGGNKTGNKAAKKQKNVDRPDISKKIESLLDIFEKKEADPCKVPVEDEGHYLLLDYSSIYYFSTADKKVKVHTEKDCYLTNLSLKDLEERLPVHFFRIHRSYIANLNKVKEVIPWFKGKYQIVMADSREDEIPVSRSKVKKLNEMLNLK